MSEPVRIHIAAGDVLGPISPYLTGACIEDVNHEIYGGLYSQMVFGESFEEEPMDISAASNPAWAGPCGGRRTAVRVEWGEDVVAGGSAHVVCLRGPLEAENTPDAPQRIAPEERSLAWRGGPLEHTLPGHSFTVLRLDKA